MDMNALFVQTVTPPASTTGGNRNSSAANNGSQNSTFAGAMGLVMKVADAGQPVEQQSNEALPLVYALISEGEETDEQNGTEEQLDWIFPVVEELMEQPEVLQDWTNEEPFRQWLNQASELLAAMGVQIADTMEQGNSEAAKENSDSVRAWSSVEVRQVLESFIRMARQNPDSGLVDQLKDKLGELMLAAQSVRKPESNADARREAAVETTPSTTLPGRSLAGTEENLSAGERMAQAAGKAQLSTSEPNHNQAGIKVVSEPDALSRLEMLTYRSGSVERVMTANAEAARGSEWNAAVSESPALAPESMQRSETMRPANQPVLPQEPIPADRFAGEMSRFVLRSFTTGASDGFSEARLSLYPEHLGHVDVKLTMHNGQLTAQFLAHTMLGKETLEAQLSQLRLQLQAQGIQVERMEVTQSNSSVGSQLFHEQRERPSQQQYSQQSRQNADRYEEDLAADSADWAEMQSSVYGSGFDVTA
ncbi:flagellar hook-length control protein FliK [Paenibacillus sp. J2TS4]|uniref:flagellar hook-length control protein FliK n=1 Tax=Paenibacillus sp. J2TS4 TaxID=2807194 RepID=UPI001B27252D|nr:flagellar hook-length control protein FliK [Paenibacillus sp. J2TS4]GIP33070.1 hypothetical protein J2TS4_22800 [Paenibacillus sp. J2TS4]